MKTKELKTIIKTLERLNYIDIPILVNDSRDGEACYIQSHIKVDTINGKVSIVVSGV